MIPKIIASIFVGIFEKWFGSHKDQQLGAAKQREKDNEADKEVLDEWQDIDSQSVSPDDAAAGLSGFGKRRRNRKSSS